MVHNLECEKARALYSLMLDNMAELKEIAYVDSHLQECVTCHKEFNRWRRISLALNQEAHEEVKAPPGFAQGVMAQLTPGKPQPSLAPSINKRPRKGKAKAAPSTFKWPSKGIAIAAAVLATLGSAYYLLPSNSPLSPIVVINNLTPQSEEQTPGTGTNTNGTENTETKPETQDKDKDKDKDKNPSEQTETTPAENAPTPESTPSTPAPTLFSSNVVIHSSMLSVTTADPVQAGDQVAALAGNYGGSARTEGTQEVDGKTKVVMRLSVPSAQASALIGGISGLGSTVNSPQSQDITASYQQALSRRQELLGLIQAGGDTSAYQLEVKTLDRQIQDWNRQANTYSIVVTLNQS